MKKHLLTLLAAAGIFSGAQAQLSAGSVAPNFTITDINGTSHNLYNYLDQGYSVVLDFSATWCGPCWSWHQSNALKTLWTNHGPAGAPGVSGTTTDDIIIIFLESDGSTTLADLQGTGGNTQGNWLAGVDYYVTNASSPGALNNQYQVPGFPTGYIICPNRLVKRAYVGYSSSTMSATALYTEASGCPAPASAPTDAALLALPGSAGTCTGSNVALQTRIQNNGTSPLTSATITASYNSTVVATLNWTGNLATYAFEDVTVGSFVLPAAGNVVYNVTATNDNNASNNSQTKAYTVSNTTTPHANITIKINLDRYGSETTWRLKNSAGTTVSQNPTYANAGANGVYPQADINLNLPNDCYTFEIFDSYGDGMCCAYGAGGYEIHANGVLIPGMSGGSFTSSETKVFKIDTQLDADQISGQNSINVYPNPFEGVTNLAVDLFSNEAVDVSIYNSVGQMVYAKNYGQLGAGSYKFDMNLENNASGLYIVNVRIGDKMITKRITLSK